LQTNEDICESGFKNADKVDYKGLGGDYFDKLKEVKTRKNLVKSLEKLGYKAELTAFAKAA